VLFGGWQAACRPDCYKIHNEGEVKAQCTMVDAKKKKGNTKQQYEMVSILKTPATGLHSNSY
jgi:hypothetical protein